MKPDITKCDSLSACYSPTDRSVKKRARAPDAAMPPTRLEPHVCRHCFGRLVSRPLVDEPPNLREFECSNCGATVVSSSVEDLCACGHPAPAGVRSGLLRCTKNPNPTPEFPSLFVAVPAAS